MSKIANGNVVYSGWLVKSPPENKFRLSGPWKIFRSKWKRRFFILFKPQGSLPHQYVLNYYNNEEGKKLKGYIDLEHCEQIIESLDLDLFPFLLAIKTYHKNRERTYFLAADTEEQMTSWVRNLCSVCGLKPEDNSSDLPPQREEDNDTFTTIQNVPSSITKQPIIQPTQGITHVPQSRDRKILTGIMSPPRHSPSTPRSSSSESHKADSAYSSQSVLTYDYPPSSEKNVVSDETYDYPPTNPHNLPKMDDVPPVRPPPPKSYLQQQEPYQNIPPNSKMLNEGIDSLDINKVVPMSTNLSANVPLSYDFPSNNASTQSAYDFPTSGQSGSSLLVIPPPGCGIDSHSYINAATRPVSHAHEDMYLAMDGLVPPAVADRTSSISDSGKSHDSYTLMSELNVYDHPPPQRPPRISKVIPKPCKDIKVITNLREHVKIVMSEKDHDEQDAVGTECDLLPPPS
ncbi:DOS [Mytilus edulis]|uniref:DOS n=1 Tax=Mytilus edulis TaxID=6550 RepID=A0A8S3V8Q8_MYTED|nr:DOS [Mytilus edulis]